jgi:hypothetical protein
MVGCINGCNKKTKARGYCQSCYYKLLRRGEIIPNTQSPLQKHILTKIDTIKREAYCLEDGLVKITTRNKEGTKWICTMFANANKRKWKAKHYLKKKIMLKDHCEICNKKAPEVRLCWDHSHSTGEFRGTLCSSCNMLIGRWNDNPQYALKAYKYLIKK